MKKLLPVLLSLLLVFNLTSQALAVNADDYWFQDSGGTWIYDEVGFELASAIEKASGFGRPPKPDALQIPLKCLPHSRLPARPEPFRFLPRHGGMVDTSTPLK